MKNIVNKRILELIPYIPGKPVEEIRRKFNPEKIVKLASNENPYPIPDSVKTVIKNKIDNSHFYPDSDSYYLRNTIADYNGVKCENILVGAGSVEIIKMIPKAFLRNGEKVLTSEKTFIFYKIAAIEAGGISSYVEVPMDEHFRYDLNMISKKIDDDIKVIFIANPNNPTGTRVNSADLKNFILSVPDSKIIVLDNAYQEYVEDQDEYLSGLDLLREKQNLIILRTFSKIYGLAGLRVGYAVGNSDLISYLGRIKLPFNVSTPAQEAAIASLQFEEFKESSRLKNLQNKKYLKEKLVSAGLKVISSDTNFLMVFPGEGVDILNEKLLKKGVIVRPLKNFGIPDAIRVTVGTQEDNEYFLKKLFDCLK